MNDPKIKKILNENLEERKQSKWTEKEIKWFKEAMKKHGSDYDKISQQICSKSRK